MSDQRKLLLVVEDETQMARLLKGALESEGFIVQQAPTGEDALQKLVTERPQLILLDIMLPGMDGMVFLEKVREKPWGKKLPVIVLTNVSPSAEIMSGVIRDEPSYYIIKADASMDEIVAKVKNVVGEQTQSS